jgi:uridine phosphorylase
MEAATLFVIASLHGIAAGGVFAIDGVAVDFDAEAYDPHREVVKQGVENSISIAVDAVSAGTGAVTGAATRKAGGDYSDWDGT